MLDAQLHLWVAVPPGLVDVAAAEVQALAMRAGLSRWSPPKNDDGGLAFTWPAQSLVALAGHLAVADQLLVRLGQWPVRTPVEATALVAQLRHLGWLPSQGVQVKVHARQGAADRARWVLGQLQQHIDIAKELTDRERPTIVHVRVGRDRVDVALDVAGESLHRRGYRLEPGEAPLRETVAAGLLQWAGHQAGMPVWDPMCGSGTLLTEAALTGQQVRQAPLACTAWPALPAQLPFAPCEMQTCVEGGDLQADSLERARRNLARAGVLGQATLRQAELGQWRDVPPHKGLVATNLPWGVRLANRAEARRLVERWTAVVRRRVPGWRAAVVVAEPQLGKSLGLLGADVLEVRNGGRTVWLVRGRVPG